MKIFCFSPFGYEGSLVTVEVDLRRGIPAVDLVGLADGAVKESRERMKSAIRNSGFEFPPERVLISLSPADLKKEGAGFDLAIALAVLSEHKQLSQTEEILVMGELELNGKVRPVRAVHAAASTAHAAGIRLCIVPAENADEAREVTGMKVFGAESLYDAFYALSAPENFSCAKSSDSLKNISDKNTECINGVYFSKTNSAEEFAEVKNQKPLVRALEIAAAGFHNLLVFGPPGCGKTLSLMKFPALVPLLTNEESQSVTRIYSVAGLLGGKRSAITKRPFRVPHQTASIEGICGGGSRLSPGEISLAHNGALFLDEAAEFRTSVLQMLRVPLENGIISLSRAGRSTVYPARFQLLMSTNPCPCGNYGSKEKICLCSMRSIEQYWKKFSAPLLDRIDLRIQAESERNSEQNSDAPCSTNELRTHIAAAVNAQRKRQAKMNGLLSASEIAAYCKCTDKASALLDKKTREYDLSARAVSGCLKVARTISDLAEKELIGEEEIEEAVTLRKSISDDQFAAGML